MKKMTFRKLFGGICCATMAMFAVSCAQGVDDETFTAGVTGQQLESPAADSFVVNFVTDAAGVEQVKLTWPTVMGAGGYLCSVWNVNDPANPITIIENQTLDGAALYFPLVEDSNFKVSVQTLGNERFNNTAAASATETVVSTNIEGIKVPVSEDLGAFITKYIADNAETLAANRAADPNYEIAFDLEPGASYAMATTADCGMQPLRVRGDRQNKPLVTLTNNAHFETGGGLKLKFLNIDAAGIDQTASGVIVMHQNPDPATAKAGNCWKCDKPVRMEGCWVANLPRSLFTHGNACWALNELRIADCIVQINCANNGSHKSCIYPYNNSSPNDGSILNIYLSNSTIYNIYNPADMSDSAYFIRFGSQKQFSSLFGTTNGVFNIQNCTLNRMVPNKDFGNRVGYEGSMTFTDNIFYDTRLIQKVLGRGGSKVTSGNIMWCPTQGVDSTDKSNYVSEQDPGFTAENLNKPLDFNAPNGGVNFKPAAGITAGDPRWL